jgi:hypothetical protein
MNRFFGWLLGLEDVVSIDMIEPTLAAPWASNEYGPFWVLLAIAGGFAGALAFYLRWQDRGSRAARTALAIARGLLFALLILTLAEPVLRLTTTSRQAPTVFVVIDGTDSMGIRDPMTPGDRAVIDKAVGLVADPSPAVEEGIASQNAGEGRKRPLGCQERKGELAIRTATKADSLASRLCASVAPQGWRLLAQATRDREGNSAPALRLRRSNH